EARMNALRRFKYRHLLRIGARDLLGDADLSLTTEELSHLADACLVEALRMADGEARRAYGAPIAADGSTAGLAVIAMGKLGGAELNYASDIDLMFVYDADGETAGGERGRLANGEYFARVCRDLVALLEEATEEGYAFRVDLRLRPEGRMGGIVLSLEGYRAYYRERAELWERQALIKARIAAGDAAVGARYRALARATAYRPGLDEHVVPAIRDRKARGRLAGRVGTQAPPPRAAREFGTFHRKITAGVHRAFREFFAAREVRPRRKLRLPSLTALRATGFRDPERARLNLQMILEGRPLVPYAAHMGATLERLYPMLIDALWKSPDPDEALHQFERFFAATGPRAGLVELLVNPELLLGLVKVCAGGDLLTELLIDQPELLASLGSPERLVVLQTSPDV